MRLDPGTKCYIKGKTTIVNLNKVWSLVNSIVPMLFSYYFLQRYHGYVRCHNQEKLGEGNM